MEGRQGKSCHGLQKKERFVVHSQITVSEGVTIPVQKINKVRFTESCGQKRVVFTREKPEPQVRFRMNEHGKVQVDQSDVLVAVGAWVVLQLRFLDDSGLGELVFQRLKLLQKISC